MNLKMNNFLISIIILLNNFIHPKIFYHQITPHLTKIVVLNNLSSNLYQFNPINISHSLNNFKYNNCNNNNYSKHNSHPNSPNQLKNYKINNK